MRGLDTSTYKIAKRGVYTYWVRIIGVVHRSKVLKNANVKWHACMLTTSRRRVVERALKEWRKKRSKGSITCINFTKWMTGLCTTCTTDSIYSNRCPYIHYEVILLAFNLRQMFADFHRGELHQCPYTTFAVLARTTTCARDSIRNAAKTQHHVITCQLVAGNT